MATQREEVVIALGVDSRSIEPGLRHAQGMFHKLKTGVGSMLDSLKGNLMAAFSVGSITAAARSVADYGAHVADVASAANVSAGFVQGFSSKVAQSGGSAELAEKSLEKLALRIGQARSGAKDAIASFEKWKIALNDSNGRAKTTEELIADIADRMRDLKDPTIRAALAAEFFGARFGQKLAPALVEGGDALNRFISKASKMSESDIKAMDQLSDTIEEMGRRSKVEGGQVLGFFAKLTEHVGGLENAPPLLMRVFSPALKLISDINRLMDRTEKKPSEEKRMGGIIALTAEEKKRIDEIMGTARNNTERGRFIESLFNTRFKPGQEKIADLERLQSGFDIQAARRAAEMRKTPYGSKLLQLEENQREFLMAQDAAVRGPRDPMSIRSSSLDLLRRGSEIFALQKELTEIKAKLHGTLRVELEIDE